MLMCNQYQPVYVNTVCCTIRHSMSGLLDVSVTYMLRLLCKMLIMQEMLMY